MNSETIRIRALTESAIRRLGTEERELPIYHPLIPLLLALGHAEIVERAPPSSLDSPEREGGP